MKVFIPSFDHNSRVAYRHGFNVPESGGGTALGKNINPNVRWSDYPAGTKSFVLICVDPDVPSVGDDANVEGRSVPHDLPRVDFYHWVVVDIPPSVNEIPEGIDSNEVTVRGKAPGKKAYGITGLNDYTGLFVGDPEMGGNYAGFDGPCPPWNDERIHHYHFKVFALDTGSLNLTGHFDGRDVMKAMEGHILDHGEWVGKYTLNKDILHKIG